MAAASGKNQRRWKNYLLNKRYQLQFTLLMAGLAAVLMGLLGWWVHTQARHATEISINNVYGGVDLVSCEEPDASGFGVGAPVPEDVAGELAPTEFEEDEFPPLEEEFGGAAGVEEDPLAWEDAEETGAEAADAEGREGEETGVEATGVEAADAEDREGEETGVEAADAEDADAEERDGEGDASARVELGDVDGEIAEREDAREGDDEGAGAVAAYYECRMEQAIELASLVGPIYRGERHITLAMVAVGFLLLAGIALYGIVMTHRVAGPLYKISLYLNKLKDGRYDTVYDLRKGDHLVAFYEQFKRAHAGLRSMQEEDLARLREAIEVAEREGLTDQSAELADVVEEMKTLAEQKEKSLA